MAESLLHRLKAHPALIVKYQHDPGLRSKLPDNLLTPAQRKVRTANATRAAIGNPLAPLTGGTLQHLARTIVDSDYAPALADADRSRQQTVADTAELQRRAAAYSQGLLGVNQGAVDASKTQGTELDATLAKIGADQQARLQTAQQQGQQGIQADQAVRGSGLQADAMGRLAQTIAAAQSQGASEAGTARTAGATNAADAQTLARTVATASANRGGEQQAGIATSGQSMLAKILADREKLSQQRTGDYTKTLVDLRQRQAENTLASATLLGNQGANAADIDLKRGIDPVTGQPLPTKAPTGYGPGAPAQNKYGYTYDEWNALSSKDQASARAGKSKGKDAKSPWATPEKQGKAADTIGNALSFAKRLKGSGVDRRTAGQYLVAGSKAASKPVYEQVKDPATGKVTQRPKLNPDGTQVTKSTEAIPSFDQLWASVALDVAYDGHISAANIKKLHARGIKINPLGYSTRATAPTAPTGAAGYDKGDRPG